MPEANRARRGNPFSRYLRWLHTQWPAGTVEKLPEVGLGGRTNVPGVRIVGDLTGIPLLKFSADSGARAVQEILAEPAFAAARGKDSGVLDLAIIGGGVSGISAAMEAKKAGLNVTLYEAARAFATIKDFPKGKPIYTYPMDMTPAGELRFHAQVKEPLVDELEAQRAAAGIEPVAKRIERLERKGGEILVHFGRDEPPARALRAIVAIGRSGNFRKLGCKGDDLPKVFNRLHDPMAFKGRQALVVGGGDSALETAIALAGTGAHVTLSYRKPEFARPKPGNVEKLNALRADPMAEVAVEHPTSERVTTGTGIFMRDENAPGSIVLKMATQVKEVTDGEAVLQHEDGKLETIANDVVFSMIGREPPLDFFRRSGVNIRGEWRAKQWVGFVAFLAFCVLLYHWKSFAPAKAWVKAHGWFPYGVGEVLQAAASAARDPANLLGTLALSMQDPAFYYSLAYCLCVCGFGVARIRRRRTPYVKRQTLALMAIQVVPLFLLPFVILPWFGHMGFLGDRKKVEVLDASGRAPWKAAAQRAAAFAPGPAPEAQSEAEKEWRIARKVAYENVLAVAMRGIQNSGQLPAGLAYWESPAIREVDAAQHMVKLEDLSLPPEERWRRQTEIDYKHGLVHILDYDNPKTFIAKKIGWVVDSLLPPVTYEPNGREYWRASGLILAWPLFIWNVFTGKPMYLWLVISLIQTFVLIPLLIRYFGKGAYCGWICSCGALAETMGDTHRHKMPHGPFWNRFNVVGQIFLAAAFLLLVLRVVSWIWPDSAAGAAFHALLNGLPIVNYSYIVDLWWAGILGVGMYFHFSGRFWCRFACPLAALMHIYARFSKFRIFPDKNKCISCNVCTGVCHQGIDVMNFANKGLPMQDPECVRCSACVNECPTGTLSFGRFEPNGEVRLDSLLASPVQIKEGAPDAATIRSHLTLKEG